MNKYLQGREADRVLDFRQPDVAPAAGDRGWGAFAPIELKDVDSKRRAVKAMVSTPALDRYGERVAPSAYARRLDRFRHYGPLLPNHRYESIDGKPMVMGHWQELAVTDHGLTGVARFRPSGRSELADAWFSAFEDGSAKAFSVGFIAHGWEMRPEADEQGRQHFCRVFTDVELLEISAVTIPANPEAVLSLLPAAPVGGQPSGDPVGSPDFQKLCQAIADLERTIKLNMDIDPGGKLFALIQDVVERSQRRAVHGCPQDDAPDRHAGNAECGIDPGSYGQALDAPELLAAINAALARIR